MGSRCFILHRCATTVGLHFLDYQTKPSLRHLMKLNITAVELPVLHTTYICSYRTFSVSYGRDGLKMPATDTVISYPSPSMSTETNRSGSGHTVHLYLSGTFLMIRWTKCCRQGSSNRPHPRGWSK